MQTQTLKAEVRGERGKGPARQLRLKGLIPAVFYGPGKKPANLAVSPEEVTKSLRGEFGRNQVLELDLKAGKELAVVRDLAVDPVSRELLHVDFYSVALDRPVRLRVPFIAKGRAVGVAAGGVLNVIAREIPVLGLPMNIPASIEVDITNLELHQSIKVRDLKMPEGVTVALPLDRPVVAVEAKEKEEIVEPTAEAAAAAAAGAPAAGAAPAAAGAAKDAKAAPAAAGKDAKAPAAKDAKKK